MPYASTLGAGLLGGLAAAVLYGGLCLQCYTFFERFDKEPRILRHFVRILWLLNTLHLSFVIHILYSFLVNNFGNPSILLHVPWSAGALAIVTAIVSFLIQSCYCYRIWILSDQNPFITYPAVIATVTATAFGIASNVKVIMLPNPSLFPRQHWLALTSLALFAFTDLYIAGVQCYLLFHQRKGTLDRTQSIVNTLIIYTVSTGLLTSILAIADGLASGLSPNNFIFVGIYFPLSDLYANSVMASLNARERLRQTQRELPSTPLSTFRFAPGLGDEFMASQAQFESSQFETSSAETCPVAV